jgi:hypothetical protein
LLIKRQNQLHFLLEAKFKSMFLNANFKSSLNASHDFFLPHRAALRICFVPDLFRPNRESSRS